MANKSDHAKRNSTDWIKAQLSAEQKQLLLALAGDAGKRNGYSYATIVLASAIFDVAKEIRGTDDLHSPSELFTKIEEQLQNTRPPRGYVQKEYPYETKQLANRLVHLLDPPAVEALEERIVQTTRIDLPTELDITRGALRFAEELKDHGDDSTIASLGPDDVAKGILRSLQQEQQQQQQQALRHTEQPADPLSHADRHRPSGSLSPAHRQQATNEINERLQANPLFDAVQDAYYDTGHTWETAERKAKEATHACAATLAGQGTTAATLSDEIVTKAFSGMVAATHSGIELT